MDPLAAAVTFAGLLAGFVVLGLAVYEQLWVELPVRHKARDVLEQVSNHARVVSQVATPPGKDQPDLQEQSVAADVVGGLLEGAAKFAVALKDLDRSTRGYLMAVVFFGIAAITATANTVA